MAAGIYIHIPFCVQKCLYCDFVSGRGTDDEMKRYQNALLNEIESTAIEENVDSVFFGGGTPSIYPAEFIRDILTLLRKKGVCSEGKTEITIEANPGTVSLDKLRRYRETGINRLSIGLQSADNEELKELGRIHDYEEFLKSYHYAREAGFSNINIDIMSGIPKQSISSYRNTLLKVLSLYPEHISAYSLIIEEDTPFYEKYREGGCNESDLPDEDTEREMYYLTKHELEKCGYNRYEISNYARDGYECIHNLKYWNRDNYYGFGAAASSLVNGTRYTNIRDRNGYMKEEGKIPNIREEILKLSRQEQMEEFMFLGLRKTEGVLLSEFRELFKTDIENIYGDIIREFKMKGLIIQQDGRLFLSCRGIDVSNVVMSEFLLD